MKKHIRSMVYRIFLGILGLKFDYRRNARTNLGIFPYSRRSPIILLVINLQELYRYLRAPRFARKSKKITRDLRNSKLGSEALILGNGPSIENLNIDQVNLDNPDVWVVNNFYQTPTLNLLKVDFYTLTNTVHAHPNLQSQNENFLEILNFIESKQASLILPHSLIASKIPNRFGGITKLFYDDRELSAWSRNTAPTKARGYVGLTLYKALAFATYMGYDNIYILGMDGTEFMGYSSNFENEILLNGNHAEGIRKMETQNWSNFFHDGMSSAFTAYAHATGDLLKFKARIFNLDERSLTTAFPKIRRHKWLNQV